MPVSTGRAPLGASTASVVRMRIIASLVLILMCLLAVWSSSHSDASTTSDAASATHAWESDQGSRTVLDEPAGDVVNSLTQALPAAAVALCLVGVCVAGMLLEHRFRLMRSNLNVIRSPRRDQPHVLRTVRSHTTTLSLTELSLSRT